jgi:Transient receptor ion channel II
VLKIQGATKIVKVFIEHPNYMAGEERIKRRTTESDPFFRTEEKSQFSPDVTPLILAAQYNNHEIVQMFLSRNHTIERPHLISCRCADCVTKQNYDSLKRSRSRLNAYRALASPAYMALSSHDPIMSTFELRQEMKKLAQVEKEFKVSEIAYPQIFIDLENYILDIFGSQGSTNFFVRYR